MGTEERVQPEALRRLAGELSQVVDQLSSAQTTIVNSAVSGEAFSPAGTPLAYAFMAAIEFAGNDAFEQADQIASIQQRLYQTAATWDAADEYSTVKEI